jgi:hypothetical protein
MGFKPCGNTCIPDTGCCNDGDCPTDPNGRPFCDRNVCNVSCNNGYMACGGRCVMEKEYSLDIDSNGQRDCEENLLKNGMFTSEIPPWKLSPLRQATITWYDEDANGYQPSSGCGLVSNDSIGPLGSTDGAVQCVEIERGASYGIWGYRWVKGSAGGVGVSVFFFSDRFCANATGSPVTNDWTNIPVGWQGRKFGFTAPATANSALVRLTVSKPAGIASYFACFDNMLMNRQ